MMKYRASHKKIKCLGILLISMLLPLRPVPTSGLSFQEDLLNSNESYFQTPWAKKVFKLRKILGILRNYKTGLKRDTQVELAELIYQESLAYNYDPELIVALVVKESSFYNWSKSRKGALGLMQILPTTGRSLAQAINIPWRGKKTLYDPYLNIKLGTHYLAKLHKRFNRLEIALTAYNYGPSRVVKMQTHGLQLPTEYAARIMDTYERFMAIDHADLDPSLGLENRNNKGEFTQKEVSRI